MGLLSFKRIEMYNYRETRINVNEFMADFNELYFRYINITPKSLCSKLKEIVVNVSLTNTSYIEQYLENKDETERNYLEMLDNILNVLDNLDYNERYFIKDTFFSGLSESKISEKLQLSKNGIEHIKHSAIIKFGLAFNLAVESENKDD